jgi:hypothetical protein
MDMIRCVFLLLAKKKAAAAPDDAGLKAARVTAVTQFPAASAFNRARVSSRILDSKSALSPHPAYHIQ